MLFRSLNLTSPNWSACITANDEYIKSLQSTLPETVLLGGILFSCLLGFSVYTAIIAHERRKKLRQKQYTIQKSEAHLSAILASAPDGLLSVDHKGVICSINDEIVNIFGYPEEELLGQSIEVLIPMKHKKQHAHYVSNYIESGKDKVMAAGREIFGSRKDGTPIALSIGLSRTIMPNGKVLITASVRDITERKRNELRLRLSEERYSQVVNSVEDHAIIALDLEGKIDSWNRLQSTYFIGKKYLCWTKSNSWW